ncbi:aminodeoxychorismate synthase component I [Dehalogenimonas sp. THU2]|uniref:aminodeoxychorismate synthase component I n=1 Tax=Dehalogenimonas sp. THU2 TaxID=3151121 RepID=UPI0032187E6A
MSKLPIIEEWPTTLTPADIFHALRDEPGVFFLDSGMAGGRSAGVFFLDSGMAGGRSGRYSFAGSQPFLTFTSRGRRITITRSDAVENCSDDPFDTLGRLLDEYKLDRNDARMPFTGGAVGYISYDAGRHLEKLPRNATDDLKLSEFRFGFYDVIFAYDHLENRGYIVSTGFPALDETARIDRAVHRIGEFRQRMSATRPVDSAMEVPSEVEAPPAVKSNFTRKSYMAAVERARQYIIAGDIFEVNLSQRFEVELKFAPPELYQRLRRINPAPFAAFLNCGEFSIISASPERFLKLDGIAVETRPIKGTRKRGGTPEEDHRLAAELIASEKDRAENMMIVDLERNDLGRVCRYGSVKVTELAALETFPTVFHLTSTVTGELAEGKDRIDLLKAAFPGGSITGAPKVRSMEIIDELEPVRRGIYTGAIGWLGFNGDLDLNIAIRTIVARGRKTWFQVGGAVTFDSDPEAEYQETLHKARALFQALGGGKLGVGATHESPAPP